MGDEVEQDKSALDHLADVLDAQLDDDVDKAKTAFHQYSTMTAKAILNPEAEVEVEFEVDDSGEEDEVAELDDINVDDINIDDHLTAD